MDHVYLTRICLETPTTVVAGSRAVPLASIGFLVIQHMEWSGEQGKMSLLETIQKTKLPTMKERKFTCSSGVLLYQTLSIRKYEKLLSVNLRVVLTNLMTGSIERSFQVFSSVERGL